MLFMYIYTHVHQKINKKFLHIGTTLESHFSIGQAGFEKICCLLARKLQKILIQAINTTLHV